MGQHNTDEHLEQAAKDERAGEVLLQGGYPDWGITALFHSAVHYVEAALADLNIHSEDHGDRISNIRNYLKDGAINVEYSILWNLNKDIRYDLLSVGRQEIEEARQSLIKLKSLLKQRA